LWRSARVAPASLEMRQLARTNSYSSHLLEPIVAMPVLGDIVMEFLDVVGPLWSPCKGKAVGFRHQGMHSRRRRNNKRASNGVELHCPNIASSL